MLNHIGLDKAQLDRKIRLLSLATLGFQNVGRDLSYVTVASTVQIQESEVERWVIDGKLRFQPPVLIYSLPENLSLSLFLNNIAIRAGLITAKISQTTRTLNVIRATPRAFEREQWEALEKRLVAWKTGLTGILDVVAAAKKKSGGPVAATGAGASVGAEAATASATTNGVETVAQVQETAA